MCFVQFCGEDDDNEHYYDDDEHDYVDDDYDDADSWLTGVYTYHQFDNWIASAGMNKKIIWRWPNNLFSYASSSTLHPRQWFGRSVADSFGLA